MEKSHGQLIVDYVMEHPYTSFAELERLFDRQGIRREQKDSEGYTTISYPLEGYINIILWETKNLAFADAYREALTIQPFVQQSANIMVYMADGIMLNYPIAKKLRNYERTHWIPTTLRVPTDKDMKELGPPAKSDNV